MAEQNKVKKWKLALQEKVDEKMQDVANYATRKGYPNVGAGVAAAGSTAAEYGLDYIPESVADAAMMAAGPLKKPLRGMAKAVKEGKEFGWSLKKEKEALEGGLKKVGDLAGETSNKAMSQLREELRKRGFNEEEIRTKLRNINTMAQEK